MAVRLELKAASGENSGAVEPGVFLLSGAGGCAVATALSFVLDEGFWPVSAS